MVVRKGMGYFSIEGQSGSRSPIVCETGADIYSFGQGMKHFLFRHYWWIVIALAAGFIFKDCRSLAFNFDNRHPVSLLSTVMARLLRIEAASRGRQSITLDTDLG